MESIPQTFNDKPLVYAWTYRDPDGEALGMVGRYHNGAGKAVVPFFKPNGSGWQAGGLADPRPLYGLDVLNKAEPSRTVLVVEGEKCAAALHSLGFVAVTSQGGSKAADKTDWKPLQGRERVYLLPDNDSPGQGYMRAVAGCLAALDNHPELSVIELPGLPKAGDVVDWIQARLPDWNGLDPVPEPEPLAGEFMQAVKGHATPVPENWITQKDEWPEPGLLTQAIESMPYPLDALPGTVRDAVKEVVDHGKMPVPIVACSALAALSVSIQALADVARDSVLKGPCSLNLLVVAISGERKSTADNAMGAAVKHWEQEKRVELEPEIQKARAEYGAWKAKTEGVKSAIKRISGHGPKRDTAGNIKGPTLSELEDDLMDLELSEPQPAVELRLFHEEATAEGLAFHVAKGWHTQALWSDEGALVVGGYGMRRESLLGFLGLLNRLWDGKPFNPTRKAAETKEIRGKRFTSNLMVQPDVLQILVGSGPTRGVGFLARYLIAWPESTMGGRIYTPPSGSQKALERFGKRLTELLGKEPSRDDRDVLLPVLLSLSESAKARWVEFHDATEIEMQPYGELFELRDFASKVADNAARVACLLHVFEKGPVGLIEEVSMTIAIRITAWHLHEAKRIFVELDEPEEMANARKLSKWLTDYGRKYVENGVISHTSILQYGPNSIRDKSVKDAALAILAEPGITHVRLVRESSHTFIHVNPKLLQRDSNG